MEAWNLRKRGLDVVVMGLKAAWEAGRRVMEEERKEAELAERVAEKLLDGREMRLDLGCKCGAAMTVYCDGEMWEKLTREFAEEHKGAGHAICTTAQALRYRSGRNWAGEGEQSTNK